jgi:hypothetical protein
LVSDILELFGAYKETEKRKEQSTVAVRGYKNKNSNIYSFSSHNTHVGILRGILQERTDVNRTREEEGENMKHQESEKKVYEREKKTK